MTHFKPSREDGRSDRRVVYELTCDAPPEELFDYETIEAALQEGIDEPIERRRVYRAVKDANRDMLREQRRYLAVVPGRGYRVLRADEHLPVALDKKATAESYLKKGMDLLRHARLDELSPDQRALHEGQLMIIGGVYHAVQASAKRHDRQDRVIEDLSRRVEQLEVSTV